MLVDNVNNPPHYKLVDGYDVIDIRDALLKKIEVSRWTHGLSLVQIDYWSRAWEYMTRFMDKNGLEDLQKAKWYLDRLVKTATEVNDDCL